jgi:hypothetical protein
LSKNSQLQFHTEEIILIVVGGIPELKKYLESMRNKIINIMTIETEGDYGDLANQQFKTIKAKN